MHLGGSRPFCASVAVSALTFGAELQKCLVNTCAHAEMVAGQRTGTQAALLFDDEGEGRGTNWHRRCHHLSCWLLRNGGAAQIRDPCRWQTRLRVLRWQNFAGEAGQFCGDGCAGDAVCCTAVLHPACTVCFGQLPAVACFGLRADHACMLRTHRCLWPVPRRVRR